MTERTVRVLDVGQCDYDHGRIRSLLEQHFDVAVERAHTIDDALRALNARDYALVLVNRILDRNGDEGIEFLRRLDGAARDRRAAVMLVSNYPDAQRAAVAAGALPGFGKDALSDPATRNVLSGVLPERESP